MASDNARRRRLRELIGGPGALLIPGCYDCVSAMLVARAGFPAAYIGSYATSASRLGLPDCGLATLDEMVGHAASVAASVDIPVIADAENGFAHAANLWRTVHAFERAGVAGIHIEDHEFGKHADVAPRLLPLQAMAEKVRAAIEAREDPDFMIIARTDANWALRDADEAVRRLNAYARAGADMVFAAGMDASTLASVRERIQAPIMLTSQPGSSLADETRAGAAAVLYYGFCLQVAHRAVSEALARLGQTGSADALGAQLTDAAAFERFIGYDGFVERVNRHRVG